MALTVSIKINGLDARATYGLEIIEANYLDVPTISGDKFNYSGKDGQIPGIQKYEGKTLKLSGHLASVAQTHAGLLSNLDALKKAMAADYHGQRQFMIEFTDQSDRYYRARLISMTAKPIGTRFTCVDCEIEITIELDDPFGIYNSLSFANVSGSPFSSPFSFGFTNNGNAISRPRILAENVGAANITNLTIINTAVKKYPVKSIASTAANLTRISGRWGDAKGALNFVHDSSPSLSYPCQGNINFGCFTITMYFRQNGLVSNTVGYLFSTTSNVISVYENTAGVFIFNINGTTITADASAAFVGDQWWRLAVGYDGSNAFIDVRRAGDYTSYGTSAGSITYRGIPTNFYIGTDATPANAGHKYIDDVRIYNYYMGHGAGEELEAHDLANAPLPVGRGCTFYAPYDVHTDGIGLQNTSLIITETVPQNSMLEIDCETMQVYLNAAAPTVKGSACMDHVSGEFPFLVPGTNGLQIIHDGSASGLNLAIEDKRRFL